MPSPAEDRSLSAEHVVYTAEGASPEHIRKDRIAGNTRRTGAGNPIGQEKQTSEQHK